MADKINLKRVEVENLYGLLTILQKDPKSIGVESVSAKMDVFVNRNLYYLEPENTVITALRQRTAKNDRLAEFEQKRIELAEKYVQKDEDGNKDITVQGSITTYNFGENADKFNADIVPLSEEYKEDIEAYEKELKEVNEQFLEEVELDVLKISYFDLESLPEQVRKTLAPLRKETDEELETLLFG